MNFETWLAFALASVVLLASPGPTVLMAVSYALDHGKRSAFAIVPGTTLGDFAAMTLSLLGAGALLAASAELFHFLKILGAAYLVWLGFQFLLQKSTVQDSGFRTARTSMRRMFWNAFAVTAFHPGGFVFFISFVPQFINPSKPALPQFAWLEVTFLTIAAINISFWILATNAVRERLKNPRLLTWFRRLGGATLIGLGITTAVSSTNT